MGDAARRIVANMKTTASTPNGPIHITILGENSYRLTHHTRRTQTVMGEVELLAQIGINQGGVEIRFETKHESATILLSEDTRHGLKGWRGCRYLDIGKPQKLWDEWYLFFETLHSAIEVCCKTGPAADAAIHDARRRF